MLRRSAALLGVSPYSIFLIQSKGLLTGMPAEERAKMLASWYHALSPVKLAELKALGAATEPFPRRPPPAERPPRPLHEYQLFVQKNYDRFARLPPIKRLQAIAKEWHVVKRKMRTAEEKTAKQKQQKQEQISADAVTKPAVTKKAVAKKTKKRASRR